MRIESEFFQYLLEKGLKPEPTRFDSVSFTYKNQTFEIHGIYPFVWNDVMFRFNSLQQDYYKGRTMFKLVIYHKGHDFVTQKQINELVILTNQRYRGIKVTEHLEEDSGIEICVELLNEFADSLKNNLFYYLDIMITINDELTRKFDKFLEDFDPSDLINI